MNWPERGLYAPGNSVPRWHIVWGTGYEIIYRLLAALESHPQRANLELLFDTEVSAIETTNGRATGIRGRKMDDGKRSKRGRRACGHRIRRRVRRRSQLRARQLAQALGRSAARNCSMARTTTATVCCTAEVAELGGAVTHLDLHWHYAAGVHHPAKRRPYDGLSLVPPRSALWLNARGERIMHPGPMPVYGDTRHLVASVLAQPGQYSWQVMNWKIAIKELAVSGCDYMTAFRYKKRLGLAASLVFGNKDLVNRLMRDCPDDIVVADQLDELMDRMDRQSLYGLQIDRARMDATVRAWDEMIARGPAYANDDQLRRIANARAYRGDRVRTCKFQRILDRKARPLIAIREFILSRKSLGGIQTDLACHVLRAGDGEPIPGLYAVGEAAGFGGGGMHGKASLEGTFLGGCVLSGRLAGRSI